MMLYQSIDKDKNKIGFFLEMSGVFIMNVKLFLNFNFLIKSYVHFLLLYMSKHFRL